MLFWKTNNKKSGLGEKGEKMAAKYLGTKGFKTIEMNFKNPYGRRLGEIDIIARKGNDMVFVEVKTRIFDKYDDNLPEESITPAKLHKLNKIANFYIKTNKLWENPYHFDAVSVWIDEDGKLAKIKHIENIFY